MTEQVNIRRARPEDADRLTEIAFAAKRHWAYPEALIELWKADLVLKSDYIRNNRVYCAQRGSELIGCCTIEQDDTHWWVEHFWVDPPHIGAGVGRSLFEHASTELTSLGADRFRVASDPNAEQFYVRMGGVRVGEQPTRPEGRTLPVLEFRLNDSAVSR